MVQIFQGRILVVCFVDFSKLADNFTSSLASTISHTSTQSPSFLSQHATQEAYPQARVLYDFTPSSPFELAVTGMYQSVGLLL